MTGEEARISVQEDSLTDRGTRIPMLRSRLRQARGRWYARFMLIGATWSAAAGLVVLCAVELAGVLLGEAGSVSGFVAFVLSVGTAVAVCAAAGVMAVALAPDDAALARVGDRRFSLQERLSTALETENARASETSSRAAPDPVRHALLADAESCAQRIEARQWFQLGLPRFAWIVPALTGVAVLLPLVQPGALGRAAVTAENGQTRDAPRLTGRRISDTAGQLRAIADVLDKDAERRSDPYLRTIARSLERLSAEARSGTIDREAVAVALDRLLQHTRRAYAQDRSLPGNGTSGSPGPADLIQSVLNDVAGDQAVTPRPPERGPADAGGQRKAAAVPHEASLDPTQPSQRKTASRVTSQPAAPPSLPPGWASVLDNLDDYERLEAYPRAQIERAIAEQQRRMRGGVQSAGAAQDAGKGEGDRAGVGSRPLGSGGRNLEKPSAGGGEMLLPDQPGDGGRIRIEIPPEAVHAEVAPPPSGDDGRGWRRLQEEPVGRVAPTIEVRKALGRYFMRSAGGQGR